MTLKNKSKSHLILSLVAALTLTLTTSRLEASKWKYPAVWEEMKLWDGADRNINLIRQRSLVASIGFAERGGLLIIVFKIYENEQWFWLTLEVLKGGGIRGASIQNCPVEP